MTKIHVRQGTGEWLDSPVDFSQATLVAASRSGSTKVFKLPTGELWEVYYLKSGDVELRELQAIPDNLTVRY